MLAASVLILVSPPQERVDRFALYGATRKHPNGISGFRPSLSATKSAKMDLRGRGASSDIWSYGKTTATAAPMPRRSSVRRPHVRVEAAWPRRLPPTRPSQDIRRPA